MYIIFELIILISEANVNYETSVSENKKSNFIIIQEANMTKNEMKNLGFPLSVDVKRDMPAIGKVSLTAGM